MKRAIIFLLFAIALSDNASIIWNTLLESGMTKAGVAGQWVTSNLNQA